MQIRWTACVLLITATVSTAARGQGFTERGAALGGVAGALTGAAIGNQNDETAEGALIGGAVGLVTGALIGGAQDRQVQRYQVAQQQQLAWQASRAVSTQDVVAMSQSGVSDPVIMNHIAQYGVQRRLEVSDVIALHQQGVSEPVIGAMQRARLGYEQPVVQPVVVTRPAPVIVEEYYYPRPVIVHPRPYFYGPYHHHYHHHHGPPGGVISFRF